MSPHHRRGRDSGKRGRHLAVVFLLASVVCLAAILPAAGTSTELHIVKLASDGYTILRETRVTWQWMEQNLPVRGDGTTHYYLQGPVFVENQDDRWNPAEDTNVQEKDMGAVKGTDVRDLCDLVGGMAEGDVLTVKANDGFSREFAYENIYAPSSRQGPVVIAWYQAAQGYVPLYQDGMRLLFLADSSSNPWGIHAMGVWDWHESADEQYWYYYYDGTQRYPTTTGLSVRSVSELSIASQEEPAGSVRVTSEPEGAAVTLDSMETGLTTPCTISDLYPGPYMVGVVLAGYDTPGEQEVEVVHGETAEVSFTLEKSADSGYTTGDGGDSSLSDGSGGSGTLPLRREGSVPGDLAVIPLTGLGEVMRSGESRNPVPDYALPGNFTPVCLCIFSADYSNPRNPARTSPEMELAIDGAVVPSGEIATDTSPGGAAGLVATECWDLAGIPVREGSTITLRMKGEPGATCAVRGGVLVSGVDRVSGSSTRYWMFEGADATQASSGMESAESETRFEFSPGAAGLPGTLSLILVTTGRQRENDIPGFQVQINENILTGSFSVPHGEMWIGELSIPALTPGTRVSGVVKTLGSPEGGLFTENRIVIIAGRVMDARGTDVVTTGTPAGELPDTIADAPAEIVVTTLATAPPTGSGASPAETPSTGAPLVAPPPASALERIIDAIFSFIFAVSGAPPISYENSSGTSTGPGEGSQPGGGGSDENPAEVPVEYTPDSGTGQVVGQPVLPAGTGNSTDPGAAPATPGEEGRITPYGGLYLESLPSDISLKIDNKPVTQSLPCVVYGLKAGSHLVRADLSAGGGRPGTARSVRTWVYPGAVMPLRLDLIGVQELISTRIVTGDGSAVSFTVDGHYPVRKAPTEVEMGGPGSFITALKDGAYLSCTPPPAYSGTPLVTIPAAGATGLHTLEVESSPAGGEVFIDGVRTERTTPCRVENVSEGLHRVTVSLAGYIPGESVIDVPVSRDPVVKSPVRFTLERYPWGDLEVRGGTEGADIFLDGFATGEKTPATLRYIPIGVHEVTLRLGDRSKASDVTVRPGELIRCSVTLE
ncbi:hypothetical protein J2741_000709 [Methanolinea mesophila]|uniref:PEGA domain-containing protein n=1 Tax=Methanolinea mesophila TaxID=547055 RepID=UPI001AE8C1B4|nr:PEGA domain-containing protein [Methanolinea mesophila]MBP1928162.1 hypothetical protein [Methanolinea mesophila]